MSVLQPDDEYRLTRECQHPEVARVFPTSPATPGPDIVVKFTCPGCGTLGVRRFTYQEGDQREPGAYWSPASATIMAEEGSTSYPDPWGGTQ